jgi:hypothetical protein
MAPPLYGSWEDNILLNAVITSTVAPLSTYALTTLAAGNPAERVLFGNTTVTITFTLPSSVLGEVLVIPMHNLTPGSTGVLTLTNSAGLSVPVTIEALEGGGFPPTLIVDFSAESNKTDDVWNLVVAGNVANLIMGGAIAIYAKKTFATWAIKSGISWQFTERLTWNETETPNEYATPYVQDYGTQSKQVDAVAYVDNGDVQYVRNWFLANHGRSRTGMFWPDPTDDSAAYYGRWQKTLEVAPLTPTKKSIRITFDEWPKGEAV